MFSVPGNGQEHRLHRQGRVRQARGDRGADLQDLLIDVCKGISFYGEKLKEKGTVDKDAGRFICEALFTTITNVAWDDDVIIDRIKQGLKVRDMIKEKLGADISGALPDCATWASYDKEKIMAKAMSDKVRITAAQNEDVRSLRELLIIGSKGIAAYADHAAILGHEKDDIYGFLMEALASTTKELSTDEMIAMVMKAGETAVNTMALLDEANTKAYGNPEITEVNIGVGQNPGILISGHDLKDMEELLKQTEGTGVDVYTHGEMLPANYYPTFKKYDHFVGNYGGSWWHQNKEFESFNGPIVLTTNCLIPIKKDNTYPDRLFTTGVVSYPGAKHIANRPEGGAKDFSRGRGTGQTMRSAARDRVRQDRRRFRASSGHGPGRQGHRRRQIGSYQALCRHGRVRRTSEGPQLLYRSGRKPPQGHGDPDRGVRQIPL